MKNISLSSLEIEQLMIITQKRDYGKPRRKAGKKRYSNIQFSDGKHIENIKIIFS